MKIPSTYDLKPAFQRLLTPMMERLRSAGVTPNGLTWTAMVLSAGVGWAFAQGFDQRWWYWVVVLGLLMRMALNALDGMMARRHEMASPSGAMLNELGDVVSDALVMWPLALFAEVSSAWVGAMLWMAAVNELAGVMGGVVGAGRRYDGPMGKSDRTLVWGVLCVLLATDVQVEPYLLLGVQAVMVGLVWSTLRRIQHAISKPKNHA